MVRERSRWRAGLLVGALLVLSGCAGVRLGLGSHDGDNGINAYPTNYKSEIVAAMHAYLKDPTGIRAAAISQPLLKSVGDKTRYVVCLQFDGKQDDGSYAGVKQIAAVFLAGRFDEFVDAAAARAPCAEASLAPFPELERVSR